MLKKLFKSKKSTKSRKKLSKRRNLIIFDATKTTSSFLTSDARKNLN